MRRDFVHKQEIKTSSCNFLTDYPLGDNELDDRFPESGNRKSLR
jgi:hypothetical protein